jgi:hypothetical protein
MCTYTESLCAATKEARAARTKKEARWNIMAAIKRVATGEDVSLRRTDEGKTRNSQSSWRTRARARGESDEPGERKRGGRGQVFIGCRG